MFPDEEEVKEPRQKVIHFIQNGHPEKLFTHTFTKPLSRHEIEPLCEANWNSGRRGWSRFFSMEGVEILEEELAYVRSGERIYVSKGEDFDSKMNFGQYELIKQLGEGGFGKVWLARSSISQQMAAIKLLRLDKITGARDIDMVFREIENLKALSHPNIVHILNCYTLSNMQLVVVMEYLQGGELLSCLRTLGHFEEAPARKIFEQLLSAVDYCHGKNIVHRDLKLQNILLVSKEDLKVKVADFGISGVADSFNPDFDMGTLKYMAPEVLSRKERINTPGVDIWACGVILYYLLFGQLPFTGLSNSNITQAIIKGSFIFPPRPTVNPTAKQLISRMLQVHPEQRIPIGEIQNHPWMVQPISKQADPEVTVEKALKLPCKSQLKSEKGKTNLTKTVIPKRLQKQKQQLLQQLNNLGASKRKTHHSESKLTIDLKAQGSHQIITPRYMLPLRGREEGDIRGKSKYGSMHKK